MAICVRSPTKFRLSRTRQLFHSGQQCTMIDHIFCSTCPRARDSPRAASCKALQSEAAASCETSQRQACRHQVKYWAPLTHRVPLLQCSAIAKPCGPGDMRASSAEPSGRRRLTVVGVANSTETCRVRSTAQSYRAPLMSSRCQRLTKPRCQVWKVPLVSSSLRGRTRSKHQARQSRCAARPPAPSKPMCRSLH